MNTSEPERREGGLAAAAMAVGGAIGATGTFLVWASATVARFGAGRSQSRRPGAFASPGGGSSGSGLPNQPNPGQLPQRGPSGGTRSFTVTGLDTTTGRLVLALFICVVVVAIVAWVAPRFWFRLGALSVGLVIGLIPLVLTAADLASPASILGVDRARLAARAIPVSAGVGLYLALIGAILAVFAAVAGLVTTRRWWAGSAPASPGPESAPPPPTEDPTTPMPPVTEPGAAQA